jgi:calcium-binding protein CML
MIAILLYSLLFIFGVICTFSTIPPTKMKFLPPWLQSLHARHSDNDHKTPSQDAVTKAPICSDSDSSSRIELRGIFATFDKNDDGFITTQELRESLKNMGISAGERDVADMVERVDSNGDGLIDFDEFRELYDSIAGGCGGGDGDWRREGEERGRDGDLKEAFDVFDGNKDGLITVEELGSVLASLGFAEGNKLEDCKEMIRKVDVDGDGMVNFDEFKRMMKSDFGRLIPVS